MAAENEKQLHQEFSSKISDEINCSICLDILVSPRTLVPCGHSFCRSCCCPDSIKNGRHRKTLLFTHCPHCRQAVEDTVPSRQLENLIETLVTVPNLLFRNDDDKQHYLKRRKAESERSSKLQVSARIRKRQRHDVSLSQNYAMAANPQAFSELRNSHITHRGIGVPFQPTTSYSATATTRPASFDPMVAPLPPPYDFAVTGSAPVLTFAPPLISSTPDASRRRPPRIAEPQRINGISASDPICID